MRLNKFALIVTIIVFFGAVNTASAQWYLGPRAGLNLMMLSTNADATTNSLTGIHGGLTLRKQLSKQVNVQMDVLYSQMGGNTFTQIDLAPVLTEVSSNNYYTYVQVPIYANIEFPIKSKQLVPYFVKDSWSSFHLYGGGFFGYGLKAEQETTVTIFNDGALISEEIGSKTEVADTLFNPIDFGIIVGAGFSFKLDENDKHRLGLDARYLMGFSNVSKIEGETVTLSALQISLTYMVKLTNRRHIRYTR